MPTDEETVDLYLSFAIYFVIFALQTLKFFLPYLEKHHHPVRKVQIVIALVGWAVSFLLGWLMITIVFLTMLASFLWNNVATLPAAPKWGEYLMIHQTFALHTGYMLANIFIYTRIILLDGGLSVKGHWIAAWLSFLLLFTRAVSEVLRNHDSMLPLSIAWAFLAIRAEFSSPSALISNTLGEQQIGQFCQANTLAVMTILVLLAIRFRFRRTRKYQRPGVEAIPLRE
ncbi:hypothetical protein FisN_9Lu109 [Fistulifera solaris]|uniref:Uncharacterized protein n=1 Tax=Fistulifera solaris TaxID=1519565 RepID=A0A1Z5KKI3_FISSO|nr:hypothetical protein FisN_9Lu109 [Fistulifera solaris]|eukprot:GAX26830.1 hypothetical protein FisN_9Lu109 [Fistulifera solaris]